MCHGSSAESAVVLAGVTVRYLGLTQPALADVTCTLACGQRTALIGPNGGGKSTLLKALVGLVPLTHGRITVLGAAAAPGNPAVAYVPQRSDVDWRFPITAAGVALMGRDVHLRWPRWPRRADRATAMAALDLVGMTAYGDRHIAALSGGQQQRVFLARALAQQAALLLLDEPFTGVDTATEALIFDLIDQHCATGGMVIVATHDLASVSAHFDQVLLVQQQIIAYGQPDQVLQPELLAEAYGGPLALFHRPATNLVPESPGRLR